MAESAIRSMTAEAFLAFEGEGDLRYEPVQGVVVAMAPAADPHGTIAGNAWAEIRFARTHKTPRHL
jgi:Uma2 family endonuclease